MKLEYENIAKTLYGFAKEANRVAVSESSEGVAGYATGIMFSIATVLTYAGVTVVTPEEAYEYVKNNLFPVTESKSEE